MKKNENPIARGPSRLLASSSVESRATTLGVNQVGVYTNTNAVMMTNTILVRGVMIL